MTSTWAAPQIAIETALTLLLLSSTAVTSAGEVSGNLLSVLDIDYYLMPEHDVDCKGHVLPNDPFQDT